MKKSIFLLVVLMTLNVVAQSSDVSPVALTYKEHKTRAIASMQVQLDTSKDLLKVRANLPILEIAVNDLYDKTLIRKKNSNSLRLAKLSRGVYTLVVRLEGTTFRKRIILY